MLPTIVLASLSDIDVNYNQLFDNHNTTVEQTCVALPAAAASALPAGGRFIMPSLGQFNMGDTKMLGALDAFGKLSSFTVSRDSSRLCFASRMMQTAFYNESLHPQE